MEQWEGGIRVNSWASGGFLPAKVRGTKYEGLACGWDWCKLSCSLLFPQLTVSATHSRRRGQQQTAHSQTWRVSR